jgi:hypothetical protein
LQIKQQKRLLKQLKRSAIVDIIIDKYLVISSCGLFSRNSN